MKVILIFLIGIIITACTTGGTIDELASRAAFEFECDLNKLKIIELNEHNYGVSGCGKKAVYVKSCNSKTCTWVLNSSKLKQ